MGVFMTVDEFDTALKDGPYAWPGGYQKYFVMANGDAISYKAAEDNADKIREAIKTGDRHDTDWRPLCVDINYEDTDLRCIETDEPIPAAYG